METAALPSGAAIVARYRDTLRSRTLAKYVAHAERWFALGRPALARGEPPTAADVAAYVAARRRLGHRDSTTDQELRAIARMYRLQDVALPRAVALDVTSDNPALEADLIAHLIGAGKAGRLRPLCRAWLAVSTLYGPRSNELQRIDHSRLDLRAGRLLVPASKGGAERWQRVPAGAAWALHAVWRPCSAVAASALFHRTAIDAGVGHLIPRGVAWHAIRRGLATAFADSGCPEAVFGPFMRWRTGGKGQDGERSRMAHRYSHPSVRVGLRGVRRAEAGDQDAAAWAAHPFADLWTR